MSALLIFNRPRTVLRGDKMLTGYTEFSYGYAFTENLIRSSDIGPAAAPMFPNLIQEAKLGYDIKINYPAKVLFFQFKIPEIIVRRTSSQNYLCRSGRLRIPFFRMPLMPIKASDQHARLVQLNDSLTDSVFYSSPELRNITEFDEAYRNINVHVSSALFSPSEIGRIPDNDKHFVVYNEYAPWAFFCSEPAEIKKRNILELARSGDWAKIEGREASLEAVSSLVIQELKATISSNLVFPVESPRFAAPRRRSWAYDGPRSADGSSRQSPQERVVMLETEIRKRTREMLIQRDGKRLSEHEEGVVENVLGRGLINAQP